MKLNVFKVTLPRLTFQFFPHRPIPNKPEENFRSLFFQALGGVYDVIEALANSDVSGVRDDKPIVKSVLFPQLASSFIPPKNLGLRSIHHALYWGFRSGDGLNGVAKSVRDRRDCVGPMVDEMLQPLGKPDFQGAVKFIHGNGQIRPQVPYVKDKLRPQKSGGNPTCRTDE
jgi:hypothetical protein